MGIQNAICAIEEEGRIVVTSYHDPAAAGEFRSGYLIFDLASNEGTIFWFDDTYLLNVCINDIENSTFVLDRGTYISNGNTGPGSLWEIDLTTNERSSILTLHGFNVVWCFDSSLNILYVCEPYLSQIAEISL
jgi:hypothetical protein